LPCPEGQYCDFGDDMLCGAADGPASACLARGVLRPLRPVCGCDGQTYGNDCERAAAGVGASVPGACEEPKPEPISCVTGGCSGELCVDASADPIFTICLWKPEYECLQTVGVCEAQADTGACGWTQTEELQACLDGVSAGK
jgi:hypothetical protein